MSCFFHESCDRSLLRIQGDDRFAFLQGLITQDIFKLEKEKAIYSCFLTPQGKYLEDFFIVRDGDSLLLDMEHTNRDVFLKKLNLYKMRSKVEITIVDDLKSVSIWGDANIDLASDALIYDDPRLKDLGKRAIMSQQMIATLKEHASEQSFDDYHHHLVMHGVPYSGCELMREKSIILECNLDELHALSWAKGCYVGQELMARTKHRGLLRKRLFTIEANNDSFECGDVLFCQSDEHVEAGVIRSKSKNHGLAMIRLEHLQKVLRGETFFTLNGERIKIHFQEWMKDVSYETDASS